MKGAVAVADFDITRNIRVIEKLKSELLGGVSDLYANMLTEIDRDDTADRTEILAELAILVYLLSNRLGVAPSALDSKALNKLRVSVLDDSNILRNDLQAVLSHMDRKKR